MGDVFTQALLVETDEPVKSRHLVSMARALNSRLLSGVGDGAQRIAYWWAAGVTRQIRNPDASFLLYPAQAEFHHFYQMLDPRDAQWPESGPGDPEGTNVANPLVAYIQGAEAIGLESERRRLAYVPTGFLDDDPLTAWRLWRLAAAQAGAYDPATGQVASPAFEVAATYGWVRTSLLSPHGNAFGGWIPHPEYLGLCADEETSSLAIFFTNLVTNEVRSFGTCPENPGDIAGIGYAPHAYYVFLNSGALVYLPKAQWMEGPYQQEPALQKTQTGALGRILNAFASEVRGTEDQRAESWMDEAFSLQEFCTRQYALAPQVGYPASETEVVPIYAAWQIGPGITGTGAGLPHINGSDIIRAGNVCHGWAAIADGLTGQCVLRLLRDGVEISRMTLDPVEGHAEGLVILDPAAGPGRLTVETVSGCEIGSGGGLRVEASERLEYKPQMHDWAFVTRLATYDGSYDRTDGLGTEVAEARKISDNLFDYGVVVPLTEGAAFAPVGIEPPINTNAVFDAARRFSQHCRILPRWNLIGYEVADGKSILYLDRYARGMSNAVPIDLLQGIAPDRLPIEPGRIVWGRRYRVAGGRINYAGRDYATGEEFTGLEGQAEFETFGGHVREVDGIRRTAEPQGFTNRWCMHATLKGYNGSESSFWKPEVYADQVTPFLDRCHVDSPEINVDKSLKAHFTFGASTLLGTESLTGQRYVKIGPNVAHYTHANRRNCVEGDTDCETERGHFYRSCRVYEPPVEIESTELVTIGGAEVVKITFTGRLHHCSGIAPASIGLDIATWDIDALRNTEPYRTTENGIREYLYLQASGINASRKVGDWALNSDLAFDADTPYGAVYPTLFFVQLIPEPYTDENDDQDEHDSPLYHDQLRQAELYLRCLCEGFIDGITTSSQACASLTIGAFDFTYENLLFAANGNRWIPWQPAAVRPDNPQGFGPNPNTDLSAEIYNSLARAVNLLTDARVYLPAELQARTHQGFAEEAVPAVDACGDPFPCSIGGNYFASGRSGLQAPSSGITSDWFAGIGAGGANQGYSMVGGDTNAEACSDGGAGSRWRVTASAVSIEFRWSTLDPDAIYALPPGIRGYLDTDAVVAMRLDYSMSVSELTYTASPLSADPVYTVAGYCGSPSGAYAWWTTTTTTWHECVMARNRVTAPPAPAGATGYAYVPGGGVGTTGGAGGSTSVSVTVIDDGMAIIRVPAVPYTGP